MHQRDRPQWRRQDDTAVDHHGPHHAAFRRSPTGWAKAQRHAVLSPRAGRPRLRAAGARDFPLADRARKSRHRRAAGPLDAATGVRTVSKACGTARQYGQPALRRRAADAVDRTCASDQSQNPLDGRADRRPGAGAGRHADRRAGKTARRKRAVDHLGRTEQPRRLRLLAAHRDPRQGPHRLRRRVRNRCAPMRSVWRS